MRNFKHTPISLFSLLLLAATALTSCSESDDTVEEFPDWEATNTAYFSNLYTTTKSLIASGNTSWKIIRSWSLIEDDEYFTADPEDNIIVEVLEEGTGEGCPIYTDYAWVHYKGSLLPSASYPEGYVFDQSYYGDFNEATALPTSLLVSSVVDGFSTALQNMHIGDYWRVYIPYQLGYGTDATDAIPAYSTLIFEIRLVAYARPDVDLPVTW